MKLNVVFCGWLVISSAILTSTALAVETVYNPAINPDTISNLEKKIGDLEKQIGDAKEFVKTRKTEVKGLSSKIKNADADTQKIIDDLKRLVGEFKTGSEIQVAVQSSMQDVKKYIDEFRAGSDAQQAAAKSLQQTLATMEKTDSRRNELVGKALAEIRRLEAMKKDLVALRIAGAFKKMGELYDEMVNEFEKTVNQTADVANSIENITQLPVQ